MDRPSMTVRMVGEKLAREAGRRSASVEVDDRKEAGADAAAAIQAIRKQAASMSDVLQELSVVVAALSNDVEEVIKIGVTTELLAKAEATFNLGSGASPCLEVPLTIGSRPRVSVYSFDISTWQLDIW